VHVSPRFFSLRRRKWLAAAFKELTGAAKMRRRNKYWKEVKMRKTLFGMIAVATLLGMAPMANAAQGCGVGWHRGPYGRCHPNRRPVVVVPGRVVVGTYYPGRGWWDGHRYWVHRYHWHGGWRYR
jgi:hypothetical protein